MKNGRISTNNKDIKLKSNCRRSRRRKREDIKRRKTTLRNCVVSKNTGRNYTEFLCCNS
jgi:hypothetical protein